MFGPQFWADLLTNLFGGFSILLNNSVSDNLARTLQTVTTTDTLTLNTTQLFPFLLYTTFIASLLGFAMALVSVFRAMRLRTPAKFKTAMGDFFGTILIGYAGLTVYSILAYIIDLVCQMFTKSVTFFVDQQGVWYDTIVNLITVADPVDSVVATAVSRVGAFLLIIQSQILSVGIIPVILMSALAYVFRNGKYTQVFIRLAVAFLVVVLASKLLVCALLSVCAIVLNWSIVAGPPKVWLLAVIMLAAGTSWITLFVAFMVSSKVMKVNADNSKVNAEGKLDSSTSSDSANRSSAKPVTVEPNYSSVPSDEVYETAKSRTERAREFYGKAQETRVNAQIKLDKVNNIAQKVVLVSETTATVAPIVAKVGGGIPYVAPVAMGVGVTAAAVAPVARKVEKTTRATAHPVQYAQERSSQTTDESR